MIGREKERAVAAIEEGRLMTDHLARLYSHRTPLAATVPGGPCLEPLGTRRPEPLARERTIHRPPSDTVR
jgi:hypothetical protein